MIRKYHNHKPQTTTRHREEEPPNHHETPGRQPSKASSPPPTKTATTPERTQSNAQQNIDQPQTTTTGATTNKKSTTTEPPPQNGQQFQPPWCPNALHRHQILALDVDSAAAEVQETPSPQRGHPTNAMYHHGEIPQSNQHTTMRQRKGLTTHRQSELKKTSS